MINTYDFQVEHPEMFSHLALKDLLFLHYKCPQATPGKWLSQKRLEYAQQLLDTNTKNVNEVAYDSGFENATHFSRVFKEKFKSSSLQYRKQNGVTHNSVGHHSSAPDRKNFDFSNSKQNL